MILRILHAMPNAWLPTVGNHLTLNGVSAEALKAWIAKCSPEIVSHVRYEDHAAAISKQLDIDFSASGVNAPNPFNSRDQFLLAVRSPGSTDIQYVWVWDSNSDYSDLELL